MIGTLIAFDNVELFYNRINNFTKKIKSTKSESELDKILTCFLFIQLPYAGVKFTFIAGQFMSGGCTVLFG